MKDWDLKKKSEFTKAMGKRQKFAKGGVIRRLGNRKYFDDGGTVLSGPTENAVNQNATNPNSGFLGTINQGLGLNNNFQAGAANIQNGTNTAQLNSAYSGAQNALNSQGQLVNTLAPQAATGVASQNALAGQLYDMTQGGGPNPAQAELAQNTANNVAQTGAQLAGARGASGNVGLMARQIAQQGADTQQQSVGQGATLEAQQQIAAQQNLANLSNNQISQAGQSVTGLNSAAQNEQALLQNANTSYNNAAVGMQSNINNVNSQTSAANQNMAANTLGGITSAASSVASMFSRGGEVPRHVKLAEMNAHSLKYADGGDVEAPNLGSFKAGDDSASAPSVASSSSLPADQTNLAAAVNKPSSPMGGGSGGGGGISSLAGLAALAAQGGPVSSLPLAGNPLATGNDIHGPGNFAQAYFSPGSASNGPSIGSSGALPANTENLSKDVKDAMSKKSKPSSSPMQTDEEAQEGYAQADATLGGDNPEEQMPADNVDINMVAHGGEMSQNYCHGPHKSHVANFLAGGRVKSMVSENEVYLSPEKVQKVVEDGANPLKIGHRIKAKNASEKAKVKGDSYSNDKIPADLEEGGVVIDREHVMSPQKATAFVHRAIARKKARG